jgi:hypothetical protein
VAMIWGPRDSARYSGVRVGNGNGNGAAIIDIIEWDYRSPHGDRRKPASTAQACVKAIARLFKYIAMARYPSYLSVLFSATSKRLLRPGSVRYHGAQAMRTKSVM